MTTVNSKQTATGAGESRTGSRKAKHQSSRLRIKPALRKKATRESAALASIAEFKEEVRNSFANIIDEDMVVYEIEKTRLLTEKFLIRSKKGYHRALSYALKAYQMWVSVKSEARRIKSLKYFTKFAKDSGYEKPFRISIHTHSLTIILRAFLDYPEGKSGCQQERRDRLALLRLCDLAVKAEDLHEAVKKNGGLERLAKTQIAKNQPPAEKLVQVSLGPTTLEDNYSTEDVEDSAQLEIPLGTSVCVFVRKHGKAPKMIACEPWSSKPPSRGQAEALLAKFSIECDRPHYPDGHIDDGAAE